MNQWDIPGLDDDQGEEPVNELDNRIMPIAVDEQRFVKRSRALKRYLYDAMLKEDAYLPALSSKCITLQYLRGIANEEIIHLRGEERALSRTMRMRLPRTTLLGIVQAVYRSRGGRKSLGFSVRRPPDRPYLVRLLRKLYPDFFGLDSKLEDINNVPDPHELINLLVGAVESVLTLDNGQVIDLTQLKVQIANTNMPEGNVKPLLKSLIKLIDDSAQAAVYQSRVSDSAQCVQQLLGINVLNDQVNIEELVLAALGARLQIFE